MVKEKIKKGQIEDIQERFSMSALESKGAKIYIINKIEIINSILLFFTKQYKQNYHFKPLKTILKKFKNH